MIPASPGQRSGLQHPRWCHRWFLLPTSQQLLTMLYSGPDNPKNCLFP